MDTKKIAGMSEKLKQFVLEYESFLKKFQSSDLLIENERLKKELADSRKMFAALEERYQEVSSENSRLRLALREQIIDEKLALIKISQHKLETYFKSETTQHEDRLTLVSRKARQKMAQLHRLAVNNLEQEKEEFTSKLEALSGELETMLEEQRRRLYQEEKAALGDARLEMDLLAQEEISDELVKERTRQNRLEVKIGLNVANKAGMLLILLGVAAAFRYSYAWFSDYMKGIVFFILGALMLAGGELFYRKQKGVFATGLIGGGIAILYSSIFYSHFLLNIMNISTAFGLAVAVTAVTVLLSLRYNSKTICSLGLAGGYLPLLLYIFSSGLPQLNFTAAMGYLFVLNSSILLISFRKRWSLVNYISFLLNIPSQTYLILNLPGEVAGILFSILTFFMYLAIILAYPLRLKTRLHTADVVLLGLNTFFNSVLIYGLLDDAGLNYLRGSMALVFCLSYAVLGRFAQKRMEQETAATVLFYGTALTFAVLMVPLQFGVRWLALGWLVEGIVLVVIGFKSKIKNMERAGWVIFMLCLAAFYTFDFQAVSGYHVPYFNFKYFSVSAGMLLIVFYYLRGQQHPGDGALGRNFAYFKYFALFNLWLYLLFTGTWLYDYAAPLTYHHDFYRWLSVAMITFATAYAISSISILYDRIVRYFCAFLYMCGCLVTLYINVSIPVLTIQRVNVTAEFLALAILIAFNIFVLLCTRRLILVFIREGNFSLEHYPLVMGIYLLVVISLFMRYQFNLSVSNLSVSLTYLLLAVAYILYGFGRRYVSIRRFGLGLSLFVTTKLFLFDLGYLTSVRRIIAYFCFGVILIGISYIYQRLEKSVEGYQRVEEV